MLKPRRPDWHETNLALFGSDIEKQIKKASADGEPQWGGAGVAAGVQVWRIESFKVVPWPRSKYGRFHTGDSYIVLHTYAPEPQKNPRKLAWQIHFWIGKESSQDEYGTAAYKAVELDNKLGMAAVQFREAEGYESDAFKKLFGGMLVYLKGGESRTDGLFWYFERLCTSRGEEVPHCRAFGVRNTCGRTCSHAPTCITRVTPPLPLFGGRTSPGVEPTTPFLRARTWYHLTPPPPNRLQVSRRGSLMLKRPWLSRRSLRSRAG